MMKIHYSITAKAALSAACVSLLALGGFSAASVSAPFLTKAAEPMESGVVAVTVSDANEEAALNFVKSTAERGLKFLSNPESTEAEKTKEFRKLLNTSFDLDTIARFALGRYWRAATPAQRNEYTALFKKMVVSVYTNRFGDYKGQKFEVTTSRPVSDSDYLVSSEIQPVDGGQNIKVDWRVRKEGNGYKIVDVYVAGVSMSVTQRSDFSSVIQRGGGDVSVLISYLKEKFS